MKTFPVVFTGTVGSLPSGSPNGLPDSNFWKKEQAFGSCYGFSIRPYMAMGDVLASGDAASGYKWTNTATGTPVPPGTFPLLARVYFRNSFEDLVIHDSSFRHFGGRRVETVTLYAPLFPSKPYPSVASGTVTSAYLVDASTDAKDAILPSSRGYLRRVPLFQADQWGTTALARPYLQLTANAAFTGAAPNPINLFGLNDDATALATYNIVGGFYIFEGVKRWRLALKGSAQSVTIWSKPDAGDFGAGGLVPNEVINPGDWGTDAAAVPTLVLEREASYVGEWIYLTADGSTPGGAQNASPVYVTSGALAVQV